ncbi:MAG: methyltransferase domain-containing protein [Proteobacteria bacterium]|nr:methyltransferase domain-containing protein [Pseudomonadota bacterium]
MPIVSLRIQHLSEAPHRIFDRDLLTRRRNRRADEIAGCDFLFAHAARDIAERLALVKRRFPVMLDLGAGAGLVGRLAKETGAGAEVAVSADLAAGLLSRAPGLLAVADEELLPFKAASLDLVVSGLALQLVNDLPGALIQIRRALKPDGLMIASLLGGLTLVELREAFVIAETEVKGGASPRVAPFADVRDLGQLLQRAGFALPVSDSEVLEVGYGSALELMRDLRQMGWANMLVERSREPISSQLLQRVVEIYAERHGRADGRVKATFEIVTLTGWAPDESQPKPLKPGSATARLADVLGGDKSRSKTTGS